MNALIPNSSNIQRWAQFLKAIRFFFDSRGYFEVSTQNMVPIGAFEGAIDTLKVSYREGTAELHSSPEIEMKVVLAECKLPIYQICKTYRDDPDTPIHSKEFTMLEFYQPHTTYREMIQTMKEFLTILSTEKLLFNEYSIQDIFLEKTGLDLSVLKTKQDLRREIENRKLVELSPTDTWEDMFFRLLIEKIEGALNPKIPTVLKNYPTAVSPLSKTHADGFAERFEIYWNSMELCNGCTELNNGDELKQRFEKENQQRILLGKSPHIFSEKLAKATQMMPPAAGVAVGLDRLFKCLYPINSCN